MFSPLWKAFGKLQRSTGNSAFASTSTKTPSRLFFGPFIIFSACWDPELNCQSLEFSNIIPKHSFIHDYSTLCTPLFGKLKRSTGNSAFAPTSTQTLSRQFSGTLIIFSAFWDPELNHRSPGFSRIPPEPDLCTLARPYVLPPLWKAFGKLPRSAFSPTSTRTRSRPWSGTLIIFSACWDPELNRQGLGCSRDPTEPDLWTLVSRPYVLSRL